MTEAVMPGSWGESPFAALTAALAAGILISSIPAQYHFGIMALGSAVLASASWLSLIRIRKWTALGCALTAVVIDGLLLGIALHDAYPVTDLRNLRRSAGFADGATLQFDGCLADEGEERDGDFVSTVDLHGIELQGKWQRSTGMAILRMPIPVAPEAQEAMRPSHGDRIRGWAVWSIPRNFQNPGAIDHAGFLARQGIFLTGRVRSARLIATIPGDCSTPWLRIIGAARRRIKGVFRRMEGGSESIQGAILTALVAGDYSGLGQQVRETFQNSGTYHVLVVSGLHVAWIAWAMAAGLRLIHVPAAAASLFAAGGIFFYTEIVGVQPSVSRALWMFLLFLAGKTLYRSASPANIALASAFFLLVLKPDWIFDAGFQLSFLSVMAICLTGAPVVEQVLKPVFLPARFMGNEGRLFLDAGRRSRIGRRIRIAGELFAEAAADRWHTRCGIWLLGAGRIAAAAALASAGMVVISLSVQLCLEPLLAYHFNRLSWIAPLANLVVVPLSSFTLAAGLGAVITSGAGRLSTVFLGAAEWFAAILLQIARLISGLPGAWQRCPTPGAGWIVAGILMVFLWSFMGWRRKYLPALYAATLLAFLSLGNSPALMAKKAAERLRPRANPTGFQQPDRLCITALDVGEGDSLVIRFPDSRTWLVDAGGLRQKPSRIESDHAFDVGDAVVSRYLWHEWIHPIECAVVTHPDIDHAGGMPAILRNFQVKSLMAGRAGSDPLMERIRDMAAGRKILLRTAAAGDTFNISGVRVEVANPSADYPATGSNENSVVLRIQYGLFSALLTGDLEKSAEKKLASSPAVLTAQFLKIAHHGSRWATSEFLLDRVGPRWAVVSVGRNNPFGHPAPEVVHRILRHGALPILTQDQGAITLATDGRLYRLESFQSGVIEEGELK
jgi:competence protein ComEC